MAQTKPKAAQFYGVSDNGTDGQFLKTDGTGGMSWDSPITNPTITSIDYPGTATAADPAGGESVIINGTLFASGITCTVGGTSAVTAFNSATQITITTPAKAAGQYTVAVTNTNGGTVSQANFIQYSGVPVWSTASGNIGSVQEGASASFQVTATEGSDTIEYSVTTGTLPTGLSLNTNTGAITGTAPSVSASTTTTFSITATDDENQTSSERSFNITVTPDVPSNHFNTSIYNGSGASQSITTGFAPDFTWIKSRSNGTWHCVADTVRGNLSRIFPNDTYQQVTNNNGFLSFDSNGFNLDGQGGGGDVNTSGRTFVAWSLKAGGTKVANTDGTQTTQVSVNNTLGFSIVSYSTNNDASKTFGHGLDAAPELIITKVLDGNVGWHVYSSAVGKSKILQLNNTNAEASVSANDYWNNSTGVNSTVFGYSYSGTTYDFISYCFTSKPGFSKVGSYTGNNVTNNIQTGFEPAFLLIKNTTAGSTNNWIMVDNKRSPVNQRKQVLNANLSNAESTETVNINFLTNGFQLTNGNSAVNDGSATYIYLAFAADPSTTTPSLANSFETETWAGNQSVRTIPYDFKPDLWFSKNYAASNNYGHYWTWIDSIRGGNSVIYSNATNAANTNASGTGSDAFSFVDAGITFNTSGSNGWNENSMDFVGYAFKAGGLASINTDGSITSLVSANQAAGFSIVEYVGTGSNATIGHGLGATPQLIIDKVYSTSGYGWTVYSEPTGTGKYLTLNSSGAVANDANFCSVVGSSTITSYYTGSSQNHIAYFFTSIAGYSKIGNFSGSGSSGNFQNIGFTPTWIMIKAYQGGGSDWYILDNKRPGGNTTREFLGANLTGSTYNASETNAMQFVTNGFQFGGSSFNTSGYDYIYLAIKEN